MDRFMLCAIFKLFYNFNEGDFCADFRKLFEYIDENDYTDPYLEGYSALRENWLIQSKTIAALKRVN